MDPTEVPVRAGDVLAGKYLVEQVLGVGGMGVVVAATHLELEERVALKFLLPAAARNPAVVARFSREARAAAKIKSEHVARVSDVGTLEDGLPYIVMEYLEGSDLAVVVARDGRLPCGVAVDYILQACEALAEAHAAGIVHRDLKPANLFLARQTDGLEIIKVLDFGISKVKSTARSGALTQPEEVFGSPVYMSPEQLKDAHDVDARADIWALGVILYELVTGTSPFDRPTVAETFGAILHEEPVPVRDLERTVPLDLATVISRCLERDPDARFANVAEFAKALFPFAVSSSRQSLDRTSRVLKRAGIPVASTPPPPMVAKAATTHGAPSIADLASSLVASSRTQPVASRGGPRLPVVAGAAVAGFIAAIAVTSLWLRHRPSPLPLAHQSAAESLEAGPAAVSLATGAPAVLSPIVPPQAPQRQDPPPTQSPTASDAPATTGASTGGTGFTRRPRATTKAGTRPSAVGAAPTPQALPPAPAPQAPAPPAPRKSDDPEGFGDRR